MNLDSDAATEILVCDGISGEVRAIDPGSASSTPKERLLESIPFPVEPHVSDLDGDGQEDLLIAGLGRLLNPGDDLVGSVWFMGRQPNGDAWRGKALMSRLPRVASVVGGDFNRDGRSDVAFAAYGWRKAGAVGMFFQEANGAFRLKQVSKAIGVSHLRVADFNKDGLVDLAGLVSQEHERVVIWWNEGGEVFREQTVFEAGTPSFGGSGLRNIDMDADGDDDLLVWNGDGLDGTGPKPYHGIAWLENTGQDTFVWHDLIRWPGVYGVVSADLDGDGDMDLVACSQCNKWDDPNRWSLMWLENVGGGSWKASGLGKTPTHLGVIDAGDFDGDGNVDLVTGGLHVMPPFDRTGRVTLWQRTVTPSAKDTDRLGTP